ncbi:Endo-1,3(4)-beta-D-glucanase [Glycine soja]|nr:Endo-1,3(4)-beta-D-glucanase [Glycine soja]
MLSDVFGYEAPNLRKLADKVGAAGYYVVVPDLLDGEPFNPQNSDRPFPAWIKDCAKVVIELAKSKLIQTAVLLHPSFISLDDIKGVDTPIAILGAEIDQVSPPELVKQFEQVLAAKSGISFMSIFFVLVASFVKIFPKVSHGWAVRYNTEDAEAVKVAEEAHQDLLDWLAKHHK